MARDESVDRPYEEWALIHEGDGTVEMCNIGFLADQSVRLNMQTIEAAPDDHC